MRKLTVKPSTRVCHACKENKPLTRDYFPVNRSKLFGLACLCRVCTREYAARKEHGHRAKLKRDVLTAYSKNKVLGCVCCGEAYIEFLTLDHIGGTGCVERKTMSSNSIWRRLRRENYPPGYRTLCYNCNCSLGMIGYCPHGNLEATPRKRIHNFPDHVLHPDMSVKVMEPVIHYSF